MKPLSKKIIWAVDATQRPIDAKKIISHLKIWAEKLKCQVQPVAVFSQSPSDYFQSPSPSWKKEIEVFAHAFVESYIKKTLAKDFLPAQIIFSKSQSNREMAHELSDYAVKSNAVLIVAYTRAKKTWNPFRLGGFVETLVTASTVPVLTINQSVSPSKNISSVLFPTNFSPESKSALETLGSMVKAFDSKITLFNQVERPMVYVQPFDGFLPSVDWATLMKEAETENTKDSNKWINKLKAQGIKCETVVQPQKKSVAVDVLEIAQKKNVDLIALSSHQGRLSQAILGGTARDILLQAKCPVLIFHRPQTARKSKSTDTKKYTRRNPDGKKTDVDTAALRGLS
jgi:nucleotide-binding universal stress UspA family protein